LFLPLQEPVLNRNNANRRNDNASSIAGFRVRTGIAQRRVLNTRKSGETHDS
jgi:hypothetical protein